MQLNLIKLDDKIRFIIIFISLGILFSFFFPFQLSSSTNSDDSNLSDSLKKQYLDDAARLAIIQMNQDSILKTEIFVPDSLLYKYYEALIAVYNSDIKNTEIVKTIHEACSSEIKEFSLTIDSSASWVEDWRNGNKITGINKLDDLITTYNIKLHDNQIFFDYYESLKKRLDDLKATHNTDINNIVDSYQLVIKTEDYVNYEIFPTLFHGIDKIRNVEPCRMIGDGDRISGSINNGSIILTYRTGWGDCPAGCLNRHYWKFSVNQNEVRLIREYGASLPINNKT